MNHNRMNQLNEVIRVMKRVENHLDTKQVLNVVERYSQALELLDAYDHQSMIRPSGNQATYILTYEECRKVIDKIIVFLMETSALLQPCFYIFWTRMEFCSEMEKS